MIGGQLRKFSQVEEAVLQSSNSEKEHKTFWELSGFQENVERCDFEDKLKILHEAFYKPRERCGGSEQGNNLIRFEF